MTQRHPRRTRKGIFLVTVLFFALLVAAYTEGALLLGPASLARASAEAGLSAAGRAARSGVDWARVRISNDPQWNASASQTFTAPGLIVREGDGQVEGWLEQDQRWSRFRIRFNYQDGPTSTDPRSDAMDDPPATWTDFPYVSCNNLMGGASRSAPRTGSGAFASSSGVWPTPQVTIPPASILLSIEGCSGQATVSAGTPNGFYGTPHKRTIQTILKAGNNQPITSAAVMSAGNLDITTFSSPLRLSAVGSETARLRSKGNVRTGDVYSANGEIRNGSSGTTTTGIRSGTVTDTADLGSDGFYQIPLSKVRGATGSLSLPAGVYVVTASGQVMYHDMDYAAYANASPAPVGTPVALPAGISLVTNTSPSGPRFRLEISSDLKITAAGTAVDFAIIPDGGAPQSADYGGVAATTPSPAVNGGAAFVNYIGAPDDDDVDDSDGWPGRGSTQSMDSTQLTQWNNVVSSLPAMAPFTTPDGVNWTRYDLGGGGWIGLPATANQPIRLGGVRPPATGQVALLAAHLNSLSGTQFTNLTGTFPGYTPSPSASPSASPGLQPGDLELVMQGGSRGLTVENQNGSITIGAQIEGNGASLVSYRDISLIGTSTDLSSNPGTSLGLNLYAKGRITIDAFKLDSAGNASFHGVNMRGVMYAWSDVNVFAGNSTMSAPFNLRGLLVAYGGDPNGSPSPGLANTNVTAQSAELLYDPGYIAGLVNGGPFVLHAASWHEF